MTSELPHSTPEQPQDPTPTADGENSEKDPLDQIRLDLKEEASQQQARKKPGWLARLTGRLQHEKPLEESAQTVEPEQPESAGEALPAELDSEPQAAGESEEGPKAFAFDIEVEEVEWSPPEDLEAEDIDDDLFSSRLEQFATGEADSPAGDEPPPSVPMEFGEELNSPFTSTDDLNTPFVIDNPVNSEIDFNAPLPPLDDRTGPLKWHEAAGEPEPNPPTSAPAFSTDPFTLEDEESPAAVEFSEAETAEPLSETESPAGEDADLAGQELPVEEEEEPGEPAAEPQTPPQNPGFFARIFPFRRAKKEPDRYSMDDEVVTGRLSLASTTGEDKPIMPEPGKPRPVEETQPPKPAGTRPFWDGVSEGNESEEDQPQTEEDFWESLTKKKYDISSPFRERSMNWAARKEGQEPPTLHTSPFHSDPDEVWPGEEPAKPAGEPAENSTPTRIPSFFEAEPAIGDEESAEELADSGYRETILPLPDADEEPVEIGELRSIALEDYVDQRAEEVSGKSRFIGWLAAHRVALIVSGLLICSLAVVLIVAWPMLMRNVAAQPVSATATPDPAALPYPVGLRLTGGWFINLQKGQLTDGVWDPTSGEWLEGTELRRVVALPWSRQSEAVIQSLLPDDEMLLHMSNNDVQTYTVRSVEQVERSERDLLTGNDPSLLIVLVKPDSDLRWVVLCAPAPSKN